MSKKGSLNLSIEAIVIIVVAFVVLGLGLTLTRAIFEGAGQKLPEAFAVTQLEATPTAENPITISQTVKIGRSSEKTMDVGFYNKGTNTAEKAAFSITSCLDKEKNNVPLKPVIASISQDVAANTAMGFRVILTEKGLLAGTYICTLAICDINEDCAVKSYETKQFFLTVTS